METAKWVDITPAMARKWLDEYNIHNRPVYESTVESYARDMKYGRWRETNQGIGFDTEGRLTDGQQRLTAIVWSGVTVRMLVVRGLSPESQEVVDVGKPRGAGDILTLSLGLKNANLCVAIVRSILAIALSSSSKISAGTIKEIMDLYKDEIETIMENRMSVKGLIYAPTLAAFAFAAKCYKEEVVDFERKYFTGESLVRGDPALTYRNFMLNRANGGGGGSSERRTIQDAALTSLMYHVLQNPLTRIIRSRAGTEFFLVKQKKAISAISELMKY